MRQEEVIKIKPLISEMETLKMQRINKTYCLFFERVNKIDKSLAKANKQREKYPTKYNQK